MSATAARTLSRPSSSLAAAIIPTPPVAIARCSTTRSILRRCRVWGVASPGSRVRWGGVLTLLVALTACVRVEAPVEFRLYNDTAADVTLVLADYGERRSALVPAGATLRAEALRTFRTVLRNRDGRAAVNFRVLDRQS